MELSDVSSATSENVAAKAFGRDKGNYLTLWEEKDSRDRDVADRVPDEAAAIYSKFRSSLFNHSFQPPESEQSIAISTTFTSEDIRSIAFIKDGDDGDKQQKQTLVG